MKVFIVATCVFLGLFCLIPQPCFAQPVIHRAIEPAQVLLDLVLKEQNLTLYLTIPGSALPLLSSSKNNNELVNHLNETHSLWQINPEAQCTLASQRIITTPGNNQKHGNTDIQGFFDFNCQSPTAIESITPNLEKTLPGVKQLNLWLTTDDWQNKQAIMMPGGIIIMQP